MTNINCLEKWKKTKALEKKQLSSGVKPNISHFWNQPHGARFILIKKNVLEHVASIVVNRTMEQPPKYNHTLSKMTAYPAHVGTLLSRRRRGRWSTTMAYWFSNGWTIVQETTGGTICLDEIQIMAIAKYFNAETIGFDYDALDESLGLIETDANGILIKKTSLTRVLTTPYGEIWDPVIVNNPNPKGLTQALLAAGFDVKKHLLKKTEMVTVLTYEYL